MFCWTILNGLCCKTLIAGRPVLAVYGVCTILSPVLPWRVTCLIDRWGSFCHCKSLSPMPLFHSRPASQNLQELSSDRSTEKAAEKNTGDRKNLIYNSWHRSHWFTILTCDRKKKPCLTAIDLWWLKDQNRLYLSHGFPFLVFINYTLMTLLPIQLVHLSIPDTKCSIAAFLLDFCLCIHATLLLARIIT